MAKNALDNLPTYDHENCKATNGCGTIREHFAKGHEVFYHTSSDFDQSGYTLKGDPKKEAILFYNSQNFGRVIKWGDGIYKLSFFGLQGEEAYVSANSMKEALNLVPKYLKSALKREQKWLKNLEKHFF